MKAAQPIPGRLDPGIEPFVAILQAGGIETFESCQGGEGHAFPEPSIRFHGGSWAGYRAFAIAMEHGMPVLSLSLQWHENNGHLEGPHWLLVFREGAVDR